MTSFLNGICWDSLHCLYSGIFTTLLSHSDVQILLQSCNISFFFFWESLSKSKVYFHTYFCLFINILQYLLFNSAVQSCTSLVIFALNLTFCYYYVNCIPLQTTICICDHCVKFSLILYRLVINPFTLVNILLHSNNLQIFWGISYFR